MIRFPQVRFLIVLLITACQPQGEQLDNLLGVWEIESIQTGSVLNRDPQPGQATFSPGHYSLVLISGDSSIRAFQERFTPTEAEMIRRYREIIVNAGTYQVENDSTLMLRPVVSRVPEFMGGGHMISRFAISGDTLSLTSLDEYSFDGVQAPWAASGDRTTLRMLRIE